MNKILLSIKKHSPEILTALGIIGSVSAVIFAVGATPKAIELIKLKKEELETDNLSVIETIKTTYKCYLPTAITETLAIVCIVCSDSVHIKRNAAIATAYTISEAALKEFKDKAVEVIGERKTEKIKDEIAKEKIDMNPVTNREIIITDKGNTLCYDVLSGRYFKSDIDLLRKCENELNQRILSETYITLNDFYYEIGLSNIKLGDELGWNINKSGLIKFEFSSQLTNDGTPCIVLGYSIAPKYDFDSI